jgi:class 3 adenylate cyclase
MVDRNAEVAPDKRIEFRVGIHLGDVVEESDGDLMGDGVNVAARLEGICEPGQICLSEDAYAGKPTANLAVVIFNNNISLLGRFTPGRKPRAGAPKASTGLDALARPRF